MNYSINQLEQLMRAQQGGQAQWKPPAISDETQTEKRLVINLDALKKEYSRGIRIIKGTESIEISVEDFAAKMGLEW